MKKKVLIISPHPDDAELGFGGSILALKSKGYTVAIVDLTTGEPTPMGSEEKRRLETEAATGLLRIDSRSNLGLPNRYLFDDKESRLLLASEIRKRRPEIILSPHSLDAHPDHLAAARIAEAARFYAKFTKTDLPGEPWYAPVFLYYYCSHLRKPAEITFLLDTSPFFEEKLKVMACYRSQFIDNPLNRSIFDHIRARDRYWGSLVGVEYAEAVYSKETIKLDDLSAIL